MELLRTRSYEKSLRRLVRLGASDDDVLAMENAISADPTNGDVIAGTGGLRKVRFAYAHRGKRGGGRTIYYAVVDDDRIYLLVAYAKADKVDLNADEKRRLKALVEELTR